MRPLHRAMVALAVAALAGCTQAPAAPAPSSETPQPDGTFATSEPTAGTIEGFVTDDELQPLPDAIVALPSAGRTATTGADGKYRFPNVPPGTWVVVGAKDGYEGQTRKISVVAGESAQTNLVLAALPSRVAYPEIFLHAALHHASALVYTAYAASLAGQDALCSGCVWSVHSATVPQALLLEVHGSHTVPNPTAPAAEYVQVLSANDTLTSFGGHSLRSCGLADDCSLPLRFWVMGAEIGNLRWFINQMPGDFAWFELEEKRDTWTTLFHGYDPLPMNFTAAGPPSP